MSRRNASKKSAGKQSPKLLSVLVVDDDPVIRALLVESFQRKGCYVVEAGNAAEALVSALEEDFSAILTDLNMPQDSGISLLEKIVRFRPKTRVFIMTGAIEVAHDERIQKLATGFFQKPFHPQVAVDVILGSKKKKRT